MSKLIKTVKELKEFLQTVPDDTVIAYYNEDDRAFTHHIGVEVSETEFIYGRYEQNALQIFSSEGMTDDKVY